MKINLLRENFMAAMRLAKEAISTRSTLPILGNVRLTTGDSTLTVAATDLEVSIVVRIGARVVEPGEVTLPAKTLADLLDQFQEEKIELALLPRETVRLTSGKATVNVKGLPADEFPHLTPAEPVNGLAVDAARLKLALAAIRDCAAPNEARPVLAGALFEFKPAGIVIAATDGFRLGTSGIPMPVPETWAGKRLILPVKSLDKVLKCLGSAETLTLSMPDPGRLLFALSNIEIAVQLLEGIYPDYKHIVPKEFALHTAFEAASLLRACKTARLLNDTGIFTLAPGEPGTLTLTAVGPEKGDSAILVDGAIEGQALTVGADLKFVVEALEGLIRLGVTNTSLKFIQPAAPIMVEPIGLAADKPQTAYVIMPRAITPKKSEPVQEAPSVVAQSSVVEEAMAEAVPA